jgi:Flp pilus assembly protein CpaB
MRALSVRGNDVIGVAGFAPALVDVPVTLRAGDDVAGGGHNVQVLTAGTLYDQEQSGRQGHPVYRGHRWSPRAPSDALAQSSGAIMLTLRNCWIIPTDTRGVRLAA